MPTLDDFTLAVRQLCDWAQDASPLGTPKSEMLAARRHLSVLYAMAVDLPRCECEWVERPLSHEEWSIVFKRFGTLPVGYYGSVCDPLEVPAGEAALGDLADDLADIWRDLKEGLLVFDDGHREAGVAVWQESFDTHWGEHAVNALGVIHYWLARNRWPD
ncbi:DUF5063 domain-containing protein [Massilia sp. Dwa41.01b]|uniref:DUF5063 domain-containing protein n=1 Tax=unclassified Massilia TaxID=2609279 RepID=UPI0016045FA7|nr:MULTISPECIES: DUF5063 domain-containing protein [unclassified Massilia]QNA90194.1 DUF5063 domain-containing protein [Massilia sp. Dwa41.01b]QNB01081.1 DUF5063 domain-containing protein [Massilia sp. Se16.2.3]